MVGIYKITSPTGRVYIGQSFNIEKRWTYYRYLSCRNQPAIYRSLKKHGFGNHKFEVLLHVNAPYILSPKIEIMDKYEQYFINKYKYDGFCLLNLRDVAPSSKMSIETRKKLSNKFDEDRKKWYSEERKGSLNFFYGKKHSDETRIRMSISSKLNKIGDKNPKARAIIQYDLDMNIICEFSTINQAAKELGISRQSINQCCNGWTKTGHGFIWRYKFKKPFNKINL